MFCFSYCLCQIFKSHAFLHFSLTVFHPLFHPILKLSTKELWSSFLTVSNQEWHETGNMRIRGSNPGRSRQPLTPCSQKNNKWFPAKNSVSLMSKKTFEYFKKIIKHISKKHMMNKILQANYFEVKHLFAGQRSNEKFCCQPFMTNFYSSNNHKMESLQKRIPFFITKWKSL